MMALATSEAGPAAFTSAELIHLDLDVGTETQAVDAVAGGDRAGRRHEGDAAGRADTLPLHRDGDPRAPSP